MDTFDAIETQERSFRSQESSGLFWNIITVLVLLSTFAVGAVFTSIFIDPQSSLNPFPPPTRATPFIPSTPTATVPPLLPPTWTPTATSEPTETLAPRPSATPLFTETPFAFHTPTPEQEVDPRGMSFVLDQGSPKALPNIFHQERGCNWMGVGGIVVDMSGSPIKTGILVELGGMLGGKPVQLLTITTHNGLASRLDYEFELADYPVNSNKTLWLQLLDISNMPLSEKVYFETYNDCEKNQIVVNFKQVR